MAKSSTAQSVVVLQTPFEQTVVVHPPPEQTFVVHTPSMQFVSMVSLVSVKTSELLLPESPDPESPLPISAMKRNC